MSSTNNRRTGPQYDVNGAIGDLIDRTVRLERSLEVMIGLAQEGETLRLELVKRVVALETEVAARRPKSRDELGELTTAVLVFLDEHAPMKFMPQVIAENIDASDRKNNVASSLAVLERKKLIKVIRREGANALYRSKHDAPRVTPVDAAAKAVEVSS